MVTGPSPDWSSHLWHGKGGDQDLLFRAYLPLDPVPAGCMTRVVWPEYRHPHARIDNHRHSLSSRTASADDTPLLGYLPTSLAIWSMRLHNSAISSGDFLLRGGTRRAIS